MQIDLENIDLDKLDAETVRRLRSAIRRWEEAQKTPAERRDHSAAARAASAAARKARTARGQRAHPKRPKAKISRGKAQQRARKAAETMRERYPERFQVKRCRWAGCGRVVLAHGQCATHDKAWRRSTLPLADWIARMEGVQQAEN